MAKIVQWQPSPSQQAAAATLDGPERSGSGSTAGDDWTQHSDGTTDNATGGPPPKESLGAKLKGFAPVTHSEFDELEERVAKLENEINAHLGLSGAPANQQQQPQS